MGTRVCLFWFSAARYRPQSGSRYAGRRVQYPTSPEGGFTVAWCDYSSPNTPHVVNGANRMGLRASCTVHTSSGMGCVCWIISYEGAHGT
ncbi:hypothetical protein GDO81_010174 [Engystomops pustulosus]|uniref:Secreted protein n=1 Tax=Engystomops pustulosus TaxID=76066 RepID=A0AAV7BYX5_ENGPU|nr:hypothetical protein GDO81_010174 [Engystomops pustulosus]